MARNPMTTAEILALPASVALVTAGRALNLGRTKAYELARSGELPVRVLRLGNAYRVPRADLLAALGLEQPASAPAA
ncbi:helix-turn-helix domain-containing protein [Streptomyces sp. TRM76130]|nr:helix-turn-helix domain-containing protein [Streptomyces sp. TRM76130]